MDKYAYLLINIFTVLGPLALSPLAPANQKAFLKKIFPSILAVAVIFIIHDIVFTDLGVWGFNYFYLTGMNIFNLKMIMKHILQNIPIKSFMSINMR